MLAKLNDWKSMSLDQLTKNLVKRSRKELRDLVKTSHSLSYSLFFMCLSIDLTSIHLSTLSFNVVYRPKGMCDLQGFRFGYFSFFCPQPPHLTCTTLSIN